MITISLCMIVKNEESIIGRCLDSIHDLVDEINIVDTGSTDGTKEIIQKYTDRIFDFVWIDDFAAARNFSFQQATKEYILWLDADDILEEEDRIKFKQLKETLSSNIDAVSMDYHVRFDVAGNVLYSVKRNRLVRRDKQFKWEGKVHEVMHVSGTIVDRDIVIKHLPIDKDLSRNLRIYERLLESGEKLSPRNLYLYADELMYHHRFEEAVKYFEEFLETDQGTIEACCKLSDCYHFLGNDEKSLEWDLRGLLRGKPNAELCCRFGHHFMEKQDFETAIFWYNLALSVSEKNSPVQDMNYETLVPHLQLSTCYFRLRNYKLASEHNEMARKYNPEIPSMY